MKVMETKIRTLIAVCALGMIGLTNINAISDNKKEIVNEKPEILAIESELTNDAIIYDARAYSDMDISNEIGAYVTTVNLSEENLLSDDVIYYSAREFSNADIENEIEDYTTNQIFTDENAMINKVNYSAKAFSDVDFENEIKNKQ
jgi:hypothetical protein